MKLYQSFIGDHQKSFLGRTTIPFDASGNQGVGQREYELFRKIETTRSGAHAEPWGLVSWKFQHKSLVNPDSFGKYAEEKFATGYDCVFINPMIGNEAIYLNVWEQGAHCGHRGLQQIAAFLAEKLGSASSRVMDGSTFSLCNYFIATPDFWTEYFNFTEQALGLLEEEAARNTEVGKIYSGPSRYSKDLAVSMRPFVIERLFSSFICCTGPKSIGYRYSVRQYEEKFGTQLGMFLYRISEMKHLAVENRDRNLLQKYHDIRKSLVESSHRVAVWQMDDPSDYFLSPEYHSAGL